MTWSCGHNTQESRPSISGKTGLCICLFGISVFDKNTVCEFDYGLCLSLCSRDYRHNALVILSFVEVDCTVNKSIECIVFTLSDIKAWEVLVTTLSNDDVTSYTLLSAPNLHTESL